MCHLESLNLSKLRKGRSASFDTTIKHQNGAGATNGSILRPQGHQGASRTSNINCRATYFHACAYWCSINRNIFYPQHMLPGHRAKKGGDPFVAQTCAVGTGHMPSDHVRARCARGRLPFYHEAINTSARDVWNNNVARGFREPCWSMM